MVKLTFYGGVDEIGGNKILVEEEDTRILLDFGTRMGYESEFFSEFLDTRANTALKDRLTIGILPKIPGIYREDLIRPDGLKNITNSTYPRLLDEDSYLFSLDKFETYEKYLDRTGKPFVDAILLSHAHLDHTGAIGYIHPSIPLYCSKESEILIKAIDDVTSFKSKAIYSKSNEVGFNTDGSTFPQSPKIIHKDVKRGCQTLADQEQIHIGIINIKHVGQDHSIPGASSYIVKASGKKILYTGDIRFHGRVPMTIGEYVNKVNDDIDILICEGTRIDSDKLLKEEEIEKRIFERISKTEGLVFIDFSWKDTARYETIRNATLQAGRTFVINARLAYILNKLGKYPKESRVKIFLKRKTSCFYSPADYSKSKHEFGLSTNWKTGIDDLHYKNGITAQDIMANPGNYVMMLSYFDLGQIFDLADSTGKIHKSMFIKAQCEPFSDEMELDEERLINWLDKFGIEYELGETPIPANCSNPNCSKLRKRIERAHVSGHASRPELIELIDRIHPKIVIPIHTQNPKAFEEIAQLIDKNIQVIIPEIEKTYHF